MMGCSVKLKDNNMEQEVFFNNRHNGILAGHSYSILDVFEISKPKNEKSENKKHKKKSKKKKKKKNKESIFKNNFANKW